MDNIKQASIAAGVRSGTGYKLQHNPIIKKWIEEERKRLRRAHMATVDRVVEKLAVSRSRTWASSYTGTTRGSWRSHKNRGEVSTTTTNTETELHDKLAALEKLAKHLGFYQQDQRPEERTDLRAGS